jgi:hypothetical protein
MEELGEKVMSIKQYTGLMKQKVALKEKEYLAHKWIFGPKRDGVTGEWKTLRKRSFVIYTLRQV